MDKTLKAKPGQAVKVKFMGEWLDAILIQSTMFHVKLVLVYNGEPRQINAEHHQVRDFMSRVGVPR
jgi:hypothetical protein